MSRLLNKYLLIFPLLLLILSFQNCGNFNAESLNSFNSELKPTDPLIDQNRSEESTSNTEAPQVSESTPAPSMSSPTELDPTVEPVPEVSNQPVITSLKLFQWEQPEKFIILKENAVIDPDFFDEGPVVIEMITNENVESTRIQTNGFSDIDSEAPFTSAENFKFDQSRNYEIEAYAFTEKERKGIKGAAYKISFSTKASVKNPPSSNKGNWDMTVKPPVLVNPMTVVLSDKSETNHVSDFNQLGCEGKRYYIKVPAGRDAKITMSKDSGPLKYPVWITGGRNVHVVGLDLKLVIQSGCDVGEANNYPNKPDPAKKTVDGRNFKNIHPRLPGGIAIRLEQEQTSFIEGVDIDINGMEADCFVVRNSLNAEDKKGLYRDSNGQIRPSRSTLNKFVKQRHFKAVNTRCVGVESLDNDHRGIGDGIHGDFLQVQGNENIGTVTLENIVYLMSGNGISIQRYNGLNLTNLKMRNYYHSYDKRYATDDRYDRGAALIFSLGADKYSFENVWTNEYLGNRNYGILNDFRVGASGQSGVKSMPGMFKGAPPWDFAPSSQVGVRYESPY